MLMHESATKGSAGITRALFADFARFCLAWKIYEYYSTPQIKGPASLRDTLLQSVIEGERNGVCEAPFCG